MNNYPDQRPVDILLVEDKIDDVRRIQQVLRQGKVKNRLHHVGDGFEAIAYLRREEPYKHAPSPGLILLSLSLPRKSGLDFLAELKSNQKFAEILVIMLADSEPERFLIENCAYAVDGSLTKPFNLPQLIKTLTTVDTLSFLLVQSTRAT